MQALKFRPDDVLSDDELQFYTGYCQRSKQIDALKAMGVPFKIHPRFGFPVVERGATLDNIAGRKAGKPVTPEPNFDKVK